METQKQCYSCAYRKSISGDAHSRCSFDFRKAGIEMPKGDAYGIKMRWYMFPFNYDPVWMREQCQAWSEAMDKALVRESSPMEDLISVLGKRF